jgi:hypothetical protein
MSVRIEVVNSNGLAMRLRVGPAPYGYSDYCSESSLRFQAAGGSVLTLTGADVGPRRIPEGDVVVVADWWNTKDRFAGVGLEEETASLLTRIFIAGLLFIAIGAMLAIPRLRSGARYCGSVSISVF